MDTSNTTKPLPLAVTRTYRSRLAVAFFLVLMCAASLAGEYAYDPAGDPQASYEAALQQSTEQQKKVLLVFGSDWCPDCRSLNRKMAQEPLATTIKDHFVVAHVDIGNWDKNMGFTEQFGEPVANGIPSIAIISSDGELLYLSQAGELATSRSAATEDLNTWFETTLDSLGEDPR
ncbi:MAG: thioredoxin family protein [Pseudomonadota bacterium]